MSIDPWNYVQLHLCGAKKHWLRYAVKPYAMLNGSQEFAMCNMFNMVVKIMGAFSLPASRVGILFH